MCSRLLVVELCIESPGFPQGGATLETKLAQTRSTKRRPRKRFLAFRCHRSVHSRVLGHARHDRHDHASSHFSNTKNTKHPRGPPVRSIPAEVAPFVDAGRRNHARQGRYRQQPFRQQPQSAASYYAEHVGIAPEMAVAVPPPSKGAPNLTTMFSRSDSASFPVGRRMPVGASSSSEGVRGPPESALPRHFSGPLFPPGCVLRKSFCGQW